MSYLYKTLTVDPGVNTGLTYWDGNNTPEWTKVLQTNDSDLDELSTQFEALFIDHDIIERVSIEDVSFWAGSLKSLAATRTGALFMLARLIGRYQQICFKYNIESELVDPRKWKGQLDNNVLRIWVKDTIGIDYDNEHVLCSVGIGLFKMGLI